MKCRVQKKLKLKLRNWSKIEAKIILDIANEHSRHAFKLGLFRIFEIRKHLPIATR